MKSATDVYMDILNEKTEFLNHYLRIVRNVYAADVNIFYSKIFELLLNDNSPYQKIALCSVSIGPRERHLLKRNLEQHAVACHRRVFQGDMLKTISGKTFQIYSCYEHLEKKEEDPDLIIIDGKYVDEKGIISDWELNTIVGDIVNEEVPNKKMIVLKWY